MLIISIHLADMKYQFLIQASRKSDELVSNSFSGLHCFSSSTNKHEQKVSNTPFLCCLPAHFHSAQWYVCVFVFMSECGSLVFSGSQPSPCLHHIRSLHFLFLSSIDLNVTNITELEQFNNGGNGHCNTS